MGNPLQRTPTVGKDISEEVEQFDVIRSNPLAILGVHERCRKEIWKRRMRRRITCVPLEHHPTAARNPPCQQQKTQRSCVVI